MSSNLFAVQLQPDLFLHGLVVRVGLGLTLLGIVLIAWLDISPSWRMLAGFAWLCFCVCELRSIATGFRRYHLLTLDCAGRVHAVSSSGRNVTLSLQTGSFVLAEVAWLRLDDDHGQSFAGLFARRRMPARTWHRLRLIWLQSKQCFGQTARP